MRNIILTAAITLAVLQAAGQQLKISGEVARTLDLSTATIAALPHRDAAMKDRDGQLHTYSGVPLQYLLDSAGVTTGRQLKGENMRKYVLVKCADGYAVLFSLAELDSSITSRKAILADQLEGKPLPENKGPFRLVVEDERKPARNCFQVTEIIVGIVND